jgi:branched-chain amino acid transport system substrate-binding protein
VVEDAGEKPDSAKLATESMISKNHPVAILGMYISRFVMAASEVTDREKVILLADALVPQVTLMGRQYLFRPGPNANNHGALAYQFVRDVAKENGVEIKIWLCSTKIRPMGAPIPWALRKRLLKTNSRL